MTKKKKELLIMVIVLMLLVPVILIEAQEIDQGQDKKLVIEGNTILQEIEQTEKDIQNLRMEYIEVLKKISETKLKKEQVKKLNVVLKNKASNK